MRDGKGGGARRRLPLDEGAEGCRGCRAAGRAGGGIKREKVEEFRTERQSGKESSGRMTGLHAGRVAGFVNWWSGLGN